MSGKKQDTKNAAAAPSGPSAAQIAASLRTQLKAARKKAKVEKSQKRKGPLKVARGTARAKRREGLVRNWRSTKGAKQMLPPVVQQVPAAA